MIIVSDLEGTLTGGETWRGLIRYLREVKGRRWATWTFLLPRLAGNLTGRLGWHDLNAHRVRFVADMPRLLRGASPAEWAHAAEWIVENVLWPPRYSGVIQELSLAQAQGARVILCSGTYQPVLDAFSSRLGFEGLGTTLVWAEGRATGAIAAAVNNGAEKERRLRAALGNAEISHAYGDTAADIPMLGLARQATIVDHDPVLRSAALRHGWRILSQAQARNGVLKS